MQDSMPTDGPPEVLPDVLPELLDGIDGAVLVSDGTAILWANHQAVGLFGITGAADLTALMDRVHPEDRPRLEALLRGSSVGHGRLARRQLRMQQPEQGETWFSVAVASRRLNDRPVRVWTLLDISERKRAEHRLSEGLGSLARLVSNLQGMAYRCSHSRQWDMYFVSDGCFDLTGYASSELLYSRTIAYGDLVPSEDLEPALRRVEEAVAARRPFRLIYRIVTATGQEKLVLDQGAGVEGSDGGISELEGFITDITDLREHLERDSW